MENKELKIIMKGIDLIHPIKVVVVPTTFGEKYLAEVVHISHQLSLIAKTWNDIKEINYISGMRAPYHLHKKSYNPNTSVDGYEIIIKFKE